MRADLPSMYVRGFISEDAASCIDLLQRVVDTCRNIENCWRKLPAELEKAAGKEGAARAVFDAFGKVGSHSTDSELT